MRYLFFYGLAFFGMAHGAHAQQVATPASNQHNWPPNPPQVVCYSKVAMRKVMDSGYSAPNPELVNKLVKSGDCLLVPYEAVKTIGFPTDNGDGPARVTVQTGHGITKLWGYPVGE
jgi:hypothetical protein